MTLASDTEPFWNRQTQTASRAELDAIHLAKIRRMVGWAYEHSPLHRALYDAAGVAPGDIRTWDDFYRRLPFTDKPDYLAAQQASSDGFGGVALGKEHWQQYFHTTGTTGQMLNEVFSQYEMHKAGSQYCYAFWDYGLRAGDSMYFCFNWGPWIGLWSFYWGARDLGLRIMSGGGYSTEERIKQIIALGPTVVVGTPTYLLHLAEVALEKGYDLAASGVRMVAGGGEAGLSIPATRARISELWGVGDMVMDAYGVGEALFIGQSCRKWGGGIHVIEDVCHSYVADPDTGEPLGPDAVGEHIITSYTHFSQPFIKYRTHDLVRRDENPDHGCGWTFAHLPGAVLGRVDFMVTIRGVNVYPTAVENLLGDLAELSTHYELHISREAGLDRMLVRVEAAAESSGHELTALDLRLNAHLRDCIGVRLQTEVVAAGTLPRYELKTTRVFDHRAQTERPSLPLGPPVPAGALP